MKTEFYKAIAVGTINPDTDKPYDYAEAMFGAPYLAAQWCEAHNAAYREWSPNSTVVEVNGRLIRAAHCFNRQMLATAIRAARDGIAVGEPVTAEAVDA